MRFFNQKAPLGMISLCGAVLLVGCGASKVDQCREIVAPIREVGIETEANQKKGESARLIEVANRIEAIKIKDPQLQGFQSQIVTSFRASGNLLAEQTTLFNAQRNKLKPTQAEKKALDELNVEITIKSAEADLAVQGFTIYCQK